MATKSILNDFLQANKGKNVRIFMCTGFQMKGTLIDYDDNNLILNTNVYNNLSYTKILINMSAVTTVVPCIC